MYPDLSYLFHDLFGTPVDNFLAIFKTFGVFLVLSIIGAGWIFRSECKALAKRGIFTPQRIQITGPVLSKPIDYLFSGLMGFIVGFKAPLIVQHFQQFKADPAAMIFSLKGSLVGGILMAGIFHLMRWWEDKRNKEKPVQVQNLELFPHDHVWEITFLAGLSGVIGSKLFSVLEDWRGFLHDPFGTFFSGSGLNVYGGLILGFIVVVRFLMKRKYSILHCMDAAAPAMIAGYGLGRIACQLSGDGDWGIVNTHPQPAWWFLPKWTWVWDYPHNVLNEGVPIDPSCTMDPVTRLCQGCDWNYCHQLVPGVYPTPIWEIFFCLVIFLLLMWFKKWNLWAGALFCIYLILNGVERFFIEKIRINDRYDIVAGWKATQAEVISVLFFLSGIIGLVWLWQRQQKSGHTMPPTEIS
jgi:prolipoprotein diacylglyceryl transferase